MKLNLDNTFFTGRAGLNATSRVIMLLFSLVATAPVLWAQSVKEPPLRETAYIDSLIRNARSLVRKNPAEGMAELRMAQAEAKRMNYSKGYIRTLLTEADYNFGINIDETLQKANEALLYYDKSGLKYPMLQADAERILADAYAEKGKKDSAAYFYYLLGKQIKEDTGYSPEFQVDIMMKLTGFTVGMNYDTAYMKRTIDQYLHKAREAAELIPDSSPYKGSIHFLEGIYYSALQQHEKASQSFIEYLQGRGEGISVPRKLSAYLNIGESYMRSNKPVLALKYIDSAVTICQQPQFREVFGFYMSIINFIRGNVLYKLEDYHGAIEHITAGLDAVEKAGTPLQIDAVEAHDVLAKAYQAIGRTNDALKHKDLYIQLHDSVLQRDRMDMVSMLEVRYGLEEKNRQIAQEKLRNAEAENKIRQKNFWLISSICIITILLLLVTLYRRNTMHRQRLQNEKINSIQQRREIEILNAAINGEERERNRIAMELHDGIGGILSAAKMNLEMARKGHTSSPVNDLDKGITLVDKASKELRKTAHNMMPEHLIQEGLVSAVEYFCDSLSGNDNTRINFQVIGTPFKLNPAFELSVYRIIQELLHNVLKHAHATQALVQLSYHNNSLSVTVEDDGVGIGSEPATTRPGIGLASVKQRVQAIKGTLALQTAKDEGTSIYMEFEPELISA